MTSNKDAVAASTLTSPAQEQQEAASPRPLQPDAEEPLVKKRRTKNFQLREDLAKSRGSVTVHVPAFEPLTFDTWDAFIQAWNGYMTRTKTMYRRRSSSTTTYWNNKHKFKKYPVPEDFKYATMAYWCTHGCIQPSRGNGVRTHLHNRYTGCSARITADVVFEVVDGEPNRVRWLVRVRNQISQHNHRISDEIYNCYTNNSSVPDELLLGPEAEQKQEPQGDGSAFEPSARILTELDPMAVDGFTTRGSSESKMSAKTALMNAPSAAVSGFMLKEALANDHKMNMAASEMQPLLEELRNTPSRVIHKRLQDVAEMVAHLQAKWHQDRIAEEAAQAHAVPIASLAVEQAAAASSEALGKTNAISSIASLPPGAAYYLTPRVEQITTETSRAVSTAASCVSWRRYLREAQVVGCTAEDIHIDHKRLACDAAVPKDSSVSGVSMHRSLRAKTRFFASGLGSADEEEHMSDHEIEGNNQDDSDDGCDFNELAAETSSLASSESSSFVCNEQATITAIRVRPMLLSEKKSGYRVIVDMSTNNDGLLIRIVNPTALPPASRGRYTPMESANFPVQFTQEFWFDYSYWSFDRSPAHQVATQSTIYDELGVLALQTVLQGHNCSVFAYGQPGAGKTYTMMGSSGERASLVDTRAYSDGSDGSDTRFPSTLSTSERRGLVPRICQGLFREVDERKHSGNPCSVLVSYVEIYDERVYDLLSQATVKQSLKIREHPENGAFVERAQRVNVTSYTQLLELIEEGNRSRSVTSMQKSGRPTRSHTVLTISLTQHASMGPGVEIPMENKLCLVDLASSERVDHSGTSGSRREAASVNRSLATLVDVVGALAKRKSHGSHQKTFVPYRNSVLTRLLKDCLGGRAKTIMIGVISPCCAHYEESIATLKSIERARSLHSTGRLQADTSRNTTLRFLGDVNELKLNLCASNEVKIPSTVSYGEVPEHNDECSGCESCDDADLTSTQAPFEAKAEEMKINLTESDDAELKYMQQRSLPMEFPVDRTEQEHPEALVSLKSVHLMNLIAICRRWQTLRQYRALDRWRKVVSLENKTTTGLLVNRDNKNKEDIKVEGNASPQRSIGRRAGCPPLHTRVSTGEARTADHVQDVVAAVDATDAICCSVVQDFLFPHHPDSPNSLLQKANTAASASLLELLASSSEFDRFEYCFDNSSNNEPPLEELTSPEGWNNVEEGELSLPENDLLKAGDEESTVDSKLSLCLDSIDMARRALGPGVHSLRCQAKGSIMTANGTVVECELLRYLDKRFITMEWSFEELMVASQLHPRSAPLLSTCEALEEMVGELCLQIIPKLCDQLPSSSSACVAGRLQLETQLEHFSDRIKRQLLPEIARGSNGSETNQSSVDAVLYLATELLVMTERIKIVWNLSGHKKRERLLQAQAAVIKNRKYAAKIADLEERNEELAAKCDALLATSGRLDGSSLNEHELDNQEHVNRDTARTDVMVEQLGMDLTLKNDENLEEKLAKEVARARDVQARNDELLSRFAVLNHALVAASARVAELEAENNLNSDAREMNLASSVTSMEAQVAKLQSELEEAHIHAQDLESQLVESKRLSQEQTSELERVKAHLSSEKDARNKVEANFVTVQMQVDELKHQPAHAESRFKDLEEAESAKREEKWQIVNTSLMDTQANNTELSALFCQAKVELSHALDKEKRSLNKAQIERESAEMHAEDSAVKHAALMDQVSIQADQISVLERCTLQDKQRLLELEARLAATVQERDEHILLFSQTEEGLASALNREKAVQCQLAGSSTRESEEMNRVRGELHESTLELASLREELAELLDHSTLQSSTIETLTLEQTETLQKAHELEVERDELTLQCQVEQDALELKERAYELLSEQSAETLSRMERQQEIEREECMAVHEALQQQTIAFQKLQARQHSIKMDYYSTIRDLKGQVETLSAKSRTLNEELAAKAKALEAVHSEAEDRIQKIEEQAKRTVHKQGEIACGLSEQLQECRTDLNASMGLWVRAETQCGVLRICIEQLNCHRTEAKEACMMQLADAESCQLRDYHRHDLAQATAETELAVHENLSSLDAWFDEVISGNPAITESLSSHQAAAISVPQSTEDRDEERLSMLKTLTDLTALTNELLVVCESSPQSNNLSVEASQNALEQHDTNKDTNGLKQDFQETIPNSKEDCKTQKMTEQKKEKASGEVVQLRKTVMKLKEALDAKDDMLLFLDKKVRRLEQLKGNKI
ncbi:hypothetical protein PC123_g3203 [Phytophthora cactorum]|nr:hypothetical protein PC123_g3203 [Phytophthora cactorum]